MKTYIKNIILITIILTIAGCVSTPAKDPFYLKGPSYKIGNVSYVPINSAISHYGLGYKWDSLGKRLTLYRDKKKVVLCVGSKIALVNNLPVKLNGPIRLRRSIVVIPKDFASTNLARVFAKRYKAIKSKREVLPVHPSAYSIGRIVLDAGHGGKDPGAIGQFGLREKDITLDLVNRLKRHLKDSGIDVALTREDDRFISLWRRADIANKRKADFFISIHANAFRSRRVSGFEVYYLSEAVDDNARAVAAAENASLKYENSSFANKKPSTALEATLRDIEYSENRVESIELAKYITETACRKLGLKNRGVKGARFYVLKGAEMPSVLIEVGFISNKSEAKRLKKAQYREMLAKAIASGIVGYKKEYETTEGFTK